MAVDVYLRPVPSDANPNDVRLYNPNVADGGGVSASLNATLGDLSLTGSAGVIVGASASLTLDGLGGGYPSIVDVTTGSDSTAGLSHTVALPGSIVAGQRLIVLIANTGGSTFPAGWTEFFDAVFTGSIAGAYRDADGTEGASITVTSGSSLKSAWAVYRIQGHDPSTPPEAATTGGISNANPNPPSLSPTWGSGRDLWLGVFGSRSAPAETISAYPSGYLLNQTYAAATGAGSLGFIGAAGRVFETGTEDPGTFTITNPASWATATVAVKGSRIGSATVPVSAAASLTLANLTLSGAASIAITATLSAVLADVTLTADAAVTGGGGPPPAPTLPAVAGVGAGHWGQFKRPEGYKVEPDRTIKVTFDTRALPGSKPPRVARITKETWRPGKKKPVVTEYDDDADLMAIILALDEEND